MLLDWHNQKSNKIDIKMESIRQIECKWQRTPWDLQVEKE